MDSGKSESIQSSSGDEEYDSRGAADQSIPSFLNHPMLQFGNRNPSHLSLHHQPPLFDIPQNYHQALSQSQANRVSLSNLEASHPSALRSGNSTTCNDPQNPHVASSAAATANQSLLASELGGLSCIDQGPPRSDYHLANSERAPAPTRARNSKKRTRASRRAPTTVLNTDTSNFRAMVQEFTGIPAPPFSGSSYSRRLDLLSGSSSSSLLGSNTNSPFETLGAFYPRPSAQKVIQPYPFVSHAHSSTLLHHNMVDAIASTTNMGENPSAPINCRFPPEQLGLLNSQTQHMLNLQNHQVLTYPPPAFQASSSSLPDQFGAKSQKDFPVSYIAQMGLSHGQVNTNSTVHVDGHVRSEEMGLRSSEGYGDGQVVTEVRREPLKSSNYDDGSTTHGHGRCKLNYSSSSTPSFLHHNEKALENASSTRGGGTVDSWICPSD